jgi:hypothetical protein
MKRAHWHPADLHGAARLAADATAAVTDLVEAMQRGIAGPMLAPGSPASLIPGLVFGSIRGVARLAGAGIDIAGPALAPLLDERASTPERDALVAVIGGVIGDHLAATGNPLAIRMELRRRGAPLVLERNALAASLPAVSNRIAVLVHGLCASDAQWKGRDADYGRLLEREHGYTPVYLRYNSGRHISENGRELAGLLETLLREWPAPVGELLLLGHSMGGLVARSAVIAGSSDGMAWVAKLRRMAFLGSPHHGAPLERGGHWFEELLAALPWAGPMSALGRIRSAGITDLRHGSLVDADWHGSDRFEHAHDRRTPSPLPDGVDCLAIAATSGDRHGDLRDRLIGDGLVPIESALGRHPDPARQLAFEDSRRIVVLRTGHIGLLGHREIADHLSRWLVVS